MVLVFVNYESFYFLNFCTLSELIIVIKSWCTLLLDVVGVVLVVAVLLGLVVSEEWSDVASVRRLGGGVGGGVSGASWGTLADLASGDALSEVTALEHLSGWSGEFFLDGGQPEGVGGAKVVASASA